VALTVQKLCALIEERKEELFQLLGALIQINSENFGTHGNEKECAEKIHQLCLSLGLESDLYSPMELEGFEKHPDYMPGRMLEEKYNVTARWIGQENGDELMLMAHHDTVEIGNLENWTSEPLSGRCEDGKIYGRGACDDKYAIAAALYVIGLLKELGFEPRKNLLFTAYCDEERGGSHGALASVLRYPCRTTVNMDGKWGTIYHCASGGGRFVYRYHTVQSVDSARMTADALPVVLEQLDTFGARRKQELEQNPYYQGTNIPDTCFRFLDVRAGNNGLDLDRGRLEFACYTDKTKEQIESELEQLDRVLAEKLAPLGMVSDGFTPATRFFHYASCSPDDEAITDMLDAAEEAAGCRPKVCGSCLSDLSVIAKYSCGSAFALGAGREFYEAGGAHQPNEWIETERLLQFTKIIGAYVLKTLG